MIIHKSFEGNTTLIILLLTTILITPWIWIYRKFLLNYLRSQRCGRFISMRRISLLYVWLHNLLHLRIQSLRSFMVNFLLYLFLFLYYRFPFLYLSLTFLLRKGLQYFNFFFLGELRANRIFPLPFIRGNDVAIGGFRSWRFLLFKNRLVFLRIKEFVLFNLVILVLVLSLKIFNQ